LEEVVDADILTFHVPLTRVGEDATYHIIDAGLLKQRPRVGVLINASRGAIADTRALLSFVEKEREGSYAVLDVWENEPEISSDLLRKVALGTPHIAGYSYDGKVKGMRILYSALCEFLGVAEEWSAETHLKMKRPPIRVGEGRDGIAELDALVRQCYDIRQDDRDLRSLLRLEGLEKRNYFDSLRKGYRKRREFPAFGTSFVRPDPALRAQVRQLGFGVAADD
jgi:erythronate-4-phosphate dehydrogenase